MVAGNAFSLAMLTRLLMKICVKPASHIHDDYVTEAVVWTSDINFFLLTDAARDGTLTASEQQFQPQIPGPAGKI
jgi:hypothetical protein